MPTGYTSIVETGCSFEQYLWRCTRAFDATIMQRDDGLDARVALSREPSTYYAEQRAKAEARMRELESMTTGQAAAAAEVAHSEHTAAIMEIRADTAAKRALYDAMRVKVGAWNPPSKEHAGLKRFMLEQLDTGCPSEYAPDLPTKLSGADWLRNEMAKARRDVAYYADADRKERERCDESTRWLTVLNAAVPQPEPSK